MYIERTEANMEKYFARGISAALLALSSLLAPLIPTTSHVTVPTRLVEARESYLVLNDVSSSAPLNIPLVVTEYSGLGRTQAPISSGIPLPFGAITDTADLWLAGPDGTTPVPAQFTALSRWDGPVQDDTKAIKWVLVDFQADVPVGGTTTYYLRSGPSGGGERESSLHAARSTFDDSLASDDGTTVTVNTAPLRFTVRRGIPFNPGQQGNYALVRVFLQFFYHGLKRS